METTNQDVVPEHYNPNQLVTYKVIDPINQTATYPTAKVTEIEYSLDWGRRWRERWNELSNKTARLENDLPDFLDMEAEEIVSAICEIFGFNPTKEIEFEASVKVTGTVSVPLADLANFSINDVDLSVDVDCFNYDVDIDTEVEYISTT